MTSVIMIWILHVSQFTFKIHDLILKWGWAMNQILMKIQMFSYNILVREVDLLLQCNL